MYLFSFSGFGETGISAGQCANISNPILKGWYADPEATIFNKTYWIYPTYSDAYDKQVFLMLFFG
jgi:hypothetical protein